MKVRCGKGHIWELNLNWDSVKIGIANGESKILCPECNKKPIAGVTEKREDFMGNKVVGRKMSKYD